MNKITLEYLTLQNFKGVKSFVLYPNSKNINVYGDNAIGKTTLIDAFLWVLKGKDSLGNAQFDIIPHDENHEQLHNLETIVELKLDINNNSVVLKKLLQEKWTRPRGQQDEVYGGTVTTYFVNSEAVKKAEYDNIVSEIVPDEKIFKLLTNVRYFNEQLTWKERRDLLFQLVPQMKDSDIIKGNDKYAPIALVAHKENFETESNRALKQLKTEQVEAKAKIEENQRLLADSETKADVPTMKKVLEAGDKEVSSYRKQVGELQFELNNLDSSEEMEVKRKADEWQWEHRARLAQVQTAKNQLVADIEIHQQRIDSKITEVEKQKKELQSLRELAVSKKKALRDYVPQTNCPTCGQYLQQTHIHKTGKEYRDNLNHEIAEITKKGKDLAETVKEMEAEIKSLNEQLVTFQEQLTEVNETIKSIESEQAPIIETKSIEKKQGLEQKITELKDKIERIEKSLVPVRTEIHKAESRTDIQARIVDLDKEFTTIGQQIIKLEQQILLIKQFRIKKNKRIADSINKLFTVNQFELFETSNEGVEKETCETIVYGSRYATNGSGSERIKSGIELCQVFSRHFKVYFPLFIDDAERITEIPATEAQQIRLVVKAGVKELSVVEETKQETLF